MYSFTPQSQPARHATFMTSNSFSSFVRPTGSPSRHAGSRPSPRTGGNPPATEPQQPAHEGGCPQADGEP